MKISVDKAVFDKIGNLKIGVLVVKNIDNTKKYKELDKLLKQVVRLAKDMCVKKTYKRHALIINWKSVFNNIKIKHHSAIEDLVHHILKNKTVKSDNMLKDLCTFYSLKTMFPVSSDDLDKIEGDIRVHFSTGKENFKTKLIKGEILLSDNKKVVARRFSWQTNELTQLTKETKNALITIDALPPVTKTELKKYLFEFSALLRMYSRGKVKFFVLSKKKPTDKIK